MLFKNMHKGVYIVLLSIILPMSAQADSDTLWNKLSNIAAHNWMEASSLSADEMDQIRSLSEQGDPNARYALGMIYLTNHDHEKAAHWLKIAAEQGHVAARYSYNQNAAGHPDMAQLDW